MAHASGPGNAVVEDANSVALCATAPCDRKIAADARLSAHTLCQALVSGFSMRGSVMDEEGFTLLEQVQTVVKINVGGSKFTTSRQTLLKDPHSLLAKMFTGDEMLQKDDEGCYFIDRDPKHFQTILTFLRDGRCVLPSQKTAVLELLQEATHFQLGGLVSLITRPSATRDADLSNFGSHLRAMVLEHRSNSGHVGESVGAVFDLMAKRLVPRIPVWEDDISLPLHVYWLYDTGSSGSPSLIAFRFKGVGNECDAGLLLSADRPGFSDWDRMWSIYSNPDDTATLSMLAKNQGVLLSIVDSKKKFFKGDDVDEVWKKTRARSLTLRIVIPSVASTQLGSIKSHNIHTPPTLYPINGSAAPAVPGEANGRSMFD